jgi:RES domain-containing protein
MTLAAKLPSLIPADITVFDWAPAPLYRVYRLPFGAAAFNPMDRGNARFSPLKVADSSSAAGTRIVPTMYAGTSIEVALMEMVLRDLPFPSAGHIVTFPSPSKEDRRATSLMVGSPLKLADFRALPLQRLGLTRTEVVDCNVSHYPNTRPLASWVYEKATTAQGIVWTSRQHGTGEAFIFFEDRIPPGTITAASPDQTIRAGPVWTALLGLLGQLGAAYHIDP